MTITVTGTTVTFPDGTTKVDAIFRQLDGNTSSTATSYSLGTYLLIDLQGNLNPTYPLPLDGWSSGPSGYGTPILVNTGPNYSAIGQAARWGTTTASSQGQLAGTWYSRGSSLFQALVVRVA